MLANAYENNPLYLLGPSIPNFDLSGRYYSISPDEQGQYGYFRSSTAYGCGREDCYTYIFDINNDTVSSTSRDSWSDNKSSVRCVAGERVNKDYSICTSGGGMAL